VAAVIFVYVHTYLPVYFFNILNVDRIKLAFVQIFSYSALFAKPLISIYFDKRTLKNRSLIFVSVFAIVFSFILLVSSLSLLIIFGIFLGVNLAFISVMDVVIDKLILQASSDTKERQKNSMIIHIGALFGAILPNVLYLMTFGELTDMNIWSQFFLIGIIVIAPIIPLMLFLNIKIADKVEEKEKPKSEINKKIIALLCIFMFIYMANGLYEYPLEPWIIEKYGKDSFGLFTIAIIIWVLLNAIGVIIAGSVMDKLKDKKIIIYSMTICGVIFVIAPFTDIISLLILFSITQLLAGFIMVKLTSLMINISQNRVAVYQLMASFSVLGIIIFLPLGTYLSGFVATEFLLVTAGVLFIVSVIPLCFIKEKT